MIGTDESRECPACALEGPADAERCPYCGYEFPGRHGRTTVAVAVILALLLAWPLFGLLRHLFGSP